MLIEPEKPTKPEIQKTLRRAAEILEAGWCQGVYTRDQNLHQIAFRMAEPGVDRFCLTGAIMRAVVEHAGLPEGVETPVLHPLNIAASDQVAFTLMEHGLTNWNDYVCTSGAQAAGKLREAADALDR